MSAPTSTQTARKSSSQPRALPRLPAASDPTRYTPEFSWRHSALYCEQVSLEQIAERVGTPTYVYSDASIRVAFQSFDRALGRMPHTICYSVKANSNLSILRLLARMGSGFDIVSGGELYRVQRAGIDANRVVFSGVGKLPEEIREALRAGILLFNVESAAELELLAREAGRLGRAAPAAIRVNPDVVAGGHRHISTGRHHHKFGLDWPDARQLYLEYKGSRFIEWKGISAHIGSQILTVAPFRLALSRLADYVRDLAREGVALRYLDFGGGLGVRYWKEKPLARAAYARAVAAMVRPLGVHLLLEPGRPIVGPAGVLLTRVIHTKRNRGKTFVIVDAAMNDFMRPALYDAIHPITPARLMPRAAKAGMLADIAGPICETGDCFLKDWPIGEVSAGDLLALWGAGAYGFSESSNYNARPRPAEVLVEGSRSRIIRRRETRADLVRGE
jgi:diaminopimelate decarboxylase